MTNSAVGPSPASNMSGGLLAPDRLSGPGLIGRDHELRILARALRQPPSFALVEGEPGIGKTRLAYELLQRRELRSRRRLIGRCHPLPDPLPLSPIIDALTSIKGTLRDLDLTPVAGALRDLVPELAGGLPPQPPPLSDPQAERHRIYRAVVDVLRALGPTVLLLEDLHWADVETVHLLSFLAAGPPHGLSLVVTYRPDEVVHPAIFGLPSRVPPGTATALVALSPLAADDVGRLVASILGSAEVSAEFAEYLHRHTAGLPYAIEEVLQLLRDREDLVSEGGRWSRRTLEEIEVPTGVRNFVLERLGSLTARQRRLAEAAAVLDSPTSELLLYAVAGLDEGEGLEALRVVLRSGLLREVDGQELDFRHALARQAVYDTIPEHVRRRLHLTSARVLERDAGRPPLGRLAQHYRAAGQVPEWAHYAERAAAQAMGARNETAAVHFLEAVVQERTLDVQDRARLATALANAAIEASVPAKAIPVVTELLGSAELPAVLSGELHFIRARLLIGDNPSAARADAEAAVAHLSARPSLAARAMTTIAIAGIREGRPLEFLHWLERAKETVQDEDGLARMIVLVDRASVLTALGYPTASDAIAAIPRETSTLAERRQWLRACTNIAAASVYSGHYERARQYLAYAAEIEEGPHRRWAALATSHIQLDWYAGRWSHLEERIDRVRGEAGLDALTATILHGHAAVMLLVRLGTDTAVAELARALRRASDTQIAESAALCGCGMVRLLLHRGDLRNAIEHGVAAVDVLRREGSWMSAADIVPATVAAMCAADRYREARQLVDEMAAHLKDRDAPTATPALLTCEAILGDGDATEVAARLAVAEYAWAGLGRPYDAAQVRERRAEHLLDARDRHGGDLLIETLEAYEQLGARWDAARVRRALRRHGVSLGHRRGGKGYGQRLSPREEEVVALASVGHTNAEIAEALFLSPRTVEKHVANALRKLGKRSRRELGPGAQARR